MSCWKPHVICFWSCLFLFWLSGSKQIVCYLCTIHVPFFDSWFSWMQEEFRIVSILAANSSCVLRWLSDSAAEQSSLYFCSGNSIDTATLQFWYINIYLVTIGINKAFQKHLVSWNVICPPNDCKVAEKIQYKYCKNVDIPKADNIQIFDTIDY